MSRNHSAQRPARPAFEIRPVFWGYVIRGTEGPPVLLQIAQGIVLALGASFTAAALLLVSLPAREGGELESMRAGLTVLFSVFALLFLWFATRGGVVELQLDTVRGELRELVRHRIGRATLLGRHEFPARASLHLERRGDGRGAALMLRLRDGAEAVCIAEGPESVLQELRRRLTEELRRCELKEAARARLTA